MHKVVANTTPLIALSRVDQLDILKKLYGEIIIPEAVIESCLSRQNLFARKR